MKTVGIIFGGESCEHDVSVISGVMAYNGIDRTKYTPIAIFVDKNGKWRTGKNLGDISRYKNLKEKELTEVCVFPSDGKLYSLTKNKRKPIAKLYAVVNCMHGGAGENGSVFATLKQSKIPCTSSGLFASSTAMDKEFTKIALKGIDVKFLPCVRITRENFYLRRESALKLIEKRLDFPVIVKPANLGSSIGISTANDGRELEKSLNLALKYDEKVIVEKALTGFREINCAVYKKGGKTIVSECEEPILAKDILSFDDKYKNPTEKVFPADISPKTAEKIKSITERIYRKLAFSGVVRVDYLLFGEEVFVNEINSVPGSLAYYLFCKTTEEFSQMLCSLIEESVDEFRTFSQSLSSYESGVLNLNSCKINK